MLRHDPVANEDSVFLIAKEIGLYSTLDDRRHVLQLQLHSHLSSDLSSILFFLIAKEIDLYSTLDGHHHVLRLHSHLSSIRFNCFLVRQSFLHHPSIYPSIHPSICQFEQHQLLNSSQNRMLSGPMRDQLLMKHTATLQNTSSAIQHWLPRIITHPGSKQGHNASEFKNRTTVTRCLQIEKRVLR